MLNDEFNAPEARRLVKTIDQMREILSQEKISLPHIVVVGDQSVGKSSVLEALSGIQLPRAQNICTRCPLELRMKNIQESQTEYATVRCEGVKEIRITDFSSIASIVTNCTEKLAGGKHNVSPKPIYLTVYKRDIQIDFTLIDLPGITRNAIDGQSKTIYKDIVNLIEIYIKPETAIVLHVIPSSVDFTTSESIQLAKQYDPQCERQLIVVSKIDKFDKGIAEKLQGLGAGSMSLKLGCVAVLNRTQEEIDQNIPFDEMKRREENFFHKTDAFKNVPERYLGSKQLVKRLGSIQQDRIRSTLPSIIDELKKQIKSKKLELKQMPAAINSEMDCWSVYTNLIRNYRETVSARVHGIYDNEIQWQMEQISPPNDPFDGRIAFQLYKRQKQFEQKLSVCFTDFFSLNYQKHVLSLLEENCGVALPNFPSFSIFERLYRMEEDKFRKPCDDLIESYVQYLKKVLVKLLNRVFAEETSYKDQMIHKLTDIILRAVDKSEEECTNDVNKVLEMERHVFTLNQYYMDTVNKIKSAYLTYKEYRTKDPNSKASSKYQVNDLIIDVSNLSNEHQAAWDIQIAMESYCQTVQKRVIDNVCQLCHYWFLTKCSLEIDSKFSSAFTSSTLFDWMREPFDQQQKRENLSRSIDAMEKALALGQSV